MILRYERLDDIEEEHLRALVADNVPEIRAIEYKREFPGRSDSATKEFLADVCSFANAGGGDIVFGVEETSGIPTAVPGVPMPNLDAEILRLESIIRTGLDPRLAGFGSRPVPLSNGNGALVLRIPRSFARPHAVSYKGRFRYYSRNSAGKYEMDATEVRNTVLASDSISERARTFRVERLTLIASGQGSSPLSGTAVMVLHILPLSAFDVPAPQVDLGLAEKSWQLLNPMGPSGGRPRYNFDGLLRVSAYPDEGPQSYAQLFRNGAVESASTYALRDRGGGRSSPTFSGGALERYVLEVLPGYLALQERLGATPPIYALLTLLGVKDFEIMHDERVYDSDESVPIDRGDLLIPEVAFDGFSANSHELASRMRPAFDAVWNACGLPHSPNYTDDGRWGLDSS